MDATTATGPAPAHGPTQHTIGRIEQLDALFGEVGEASRRKEVPTIHPVYQRWIEASPFAVLATSGPDGLDTSPRGDPAGFVVVQDERTLLLPERRGNNRADSLRNIVSDPRVSLIFLIPGVGETLRVNGRATISVEPGLLQRMAMQGALPKCVLVVDVQTVFFQCARAIQRSRLWEPAASDVRERVPSAGAMLEALTQAQIDGAKYDSELPARQRATLY
jgi:PPOX class probable FMN-dependent enzyme